MASNSWPCQALSKTLLLSCLCIGVTLGYAKWIEPQYYQSAEIAHKLKSCIKYYYTIHEVDAKIDDFMILLLTEQHWLDLQEKIDDFRIYQRSVYDELRKKKREFSESGQRYIPYKEHQQLLKEFVDPTIRKLNTSIVQLELEIDNITHALNIKQAEIWGAKNTSELQAKRIQRTLSHLASMNIWLTPLPGNEGPRRPGSKLIATSKDSPHYNPYLFEIESLELLHDQFYELSQMNCTTEVHDEDDKKLIRHMQRYPNQNFDDLPCSKEECTYLRCMQMKYESIPSALKVHKLSLEQYAPYVTVFNGIQHGYKFPGISMGQKTVRFLIDMQMRMIHLKQQSLIERLEIYKSSKPKKSKLPTEFEAEMEFLKSLGRFFTSLL